MTGDFFEVLERACREKQSLLCVGLDPRVEAGTAEEAAGLILERNKRVIGETLEHAACYKPNIAFYEAWGPAGLQALRETLRLIPPEVPVILDAKRNDIGQTAQAYARAVFEQWKVPAVTLNPYLGPESIKPFLAYPGRGLFMLCRTSNPASGDLQALEVRSPGPSRGGGIGQAARRTDDGGAGQWGRPLYLEVAREVMSWSPGMALVVGATDPAALARVRAQHPDVWVLCPGIGAQGGSLEQALQAGCRRDGLGLLAVVGRDVYQDERPGEKARQYRERTAAGLRRPRRAAKAAAVEPPALEELARQIDKVALLGALLDHGCLQFGAFKLKSGATSPHYLDLRRIISSPSLLSRVAAAYGRLLESLRFDRLAAIPVAAVPIATAVSLQRELPLLYPRIVDKGHGNGNRIDGDFRAGERVVLLDDVISSAQSKLEAIDVLEAEGLEVSDLVVLVDRESGGREEVERRGVRFHALARISELLALARTRGLGPGVPAAAQRDLAGEVLW